MNTLWSSGSVYMALCRYSNSLVRNCACVVLISSPLSKSFGISFVLLCKAEKLEKFALIIFVVYSNSCNVRSLSFSMWLMMYRLYVHPWKFRGSSLWIFSTSNNSFSQFTLGWFSSSHVRWFHIQYTLGNSRNFAMLYSSSLSNKSTRPSSPKDCI